VEGKPKAVAKVFQFGLSMAFSPPFCERDLKVYPISNAPWFRKHLDIPFLLFTQGRGTVLEFDAAREEVKRYAPDGKAMTESVDYLKKYGVGKRTALMRVTRPQEGQSVRWGEEGFAIRFHSPPSAKTRAVVLNQHYAWAAERYGLSRDEEGWARLHFNEKIVRDALAYFNREPVFLWVESLDKENRVFHRSPLIRFSLFVEE
jgi:hypothetical protein